MTLSLFAAFLLVAALEDVRRYRIPNVVIVILAAIYPVYIFVAPFEVSFAWSFGVATTFFLIGVGLFAAGIMGGGDVKLMTVAGLWAGLEGLFPFLIGMALVGGAMSLFMMMAPARNGCAYLCAHMGLYSIQEKIMTDKLPYGVAICAGGLYAAYTIYGVA
ncbi:prepilin peptidase [Terasakiella sp. A23]|uniref:A24 family peptidase n=1 Tax=Terasakiella sp. FCG-A23 TaxID=3080561 RepID=UPI0029532D0A|nr:prepilin peptidase [Terasakiella sp. A23]MDV7340378.1 prepilin peptidase [Terasakiella sp. A23]